MIAIVSLDTADRIVKVHSAIFAEVFVYISNLENHLFINKYRI